MSALEKTPNLDTQDERPAQKAGIFLDGTVSEHFEVPDRIFELQARLTSLQKAGRLLGQRAMPGAVTVYSLPDSPENI